MSKNRWLPILSCILALSGVVRAQEPVTVTKPPTDVPRQFRFLFGDDQDIFKGLDSLKAPEFAREMFKREWAHLPYDTISLQRGTCMILSCPQYTVTLHRGDVERWGVAEL